MSQTGQGETPPNSMRERLFVPPRVKSRWTGWVALAGLMMIVLGIFSAIEGLTALFRHTYYAVRDSGLLVEVSYTTWGWAHLLIGVIALAAGFALLAGYLWARIIGVLIALVSATTQLAFVAAAPVWP